MVNPLYMSGYPRGHYAHCECEICTGVFAYHNDGSRCGCVGCIAFRNARLFVAPIYTEDEEKAPMAMVALCDRCGHMGLSTTFGTILWRFTDSDQQTGKNVCPGCIAEFWQFIQEKGGERPPEPFREPFRVIEPKPEESASFMDTLANGILERLNRAKELESGKPSIRESDD